MSQAAVVGASDHYGRAELVTLALRGCAPVLLDRCRVLLIGENLPGAPYHHEALDMELAAATRLLERVRHSVAEHARAGIAALREEHRVAALILPASPYEVLPADLAEVLSNRRLTNAADGMLYREALAAAAASAGLEVHRYPRQADPMALAADALALGVHEVARLVAELGRAAGPPWRKDHKLAAAAALSVLGRKFRR